MPKTTTAEFDGIWLQKTGKKAVVRIRYKRRYWNGSAYVYEANWTTIDQENIVGIGSISMSLDDQFLSTFRASNVTISLKNLYNEWLDLDVSPSVFAIDAIATVGYDSYKTKFNIQVGYTLSGGTNEWLSIFTGLAKTYSFDPLKGSVSVTIIGNELLMESADAQNVSTAFTQESTSPATGDGAETVFYTTSVGVGQISEVRVGGTVKTQGTDYAIDDTDIYNTPAKITFESASTPGAGVAVDATGIKWRALDNIETLVGLLCDEAGIGSGVRTVNPVIFPGGLSGTKTLDTDAQWQAGTQTQNISTNAPNGSIVQKWVAIDTFADGNYTADPVWTVQTNTGGATISAATNALVITTADTPLTTKQLIVTTLQAKAYGTWDFDITTYLSEDIDATFYFTLMRTTMTGNSNGYGFGVQHTVGGGINFYRWDNGVATNISGGNFGNINTATHIRITRTSTGDFTFYQNGSSVATFTDNTYTTSAYMEINQSSTSGTNLVTTLDNIYYSPEVLTTDIETTNADYISESFDIFSIPTQLGIIEKTQTLNGGTITYYTDTSVDNSIWDGWVAASSNGQINSTLRRYFKIKIEIRHASGSLTSPQVDKIVANFMTTAVNVTLANHSGKSVYAMIQRYAQICNYEMLFDGDGNFLFRSKTPGADSVVSLNQNDGISKLSKYDPGYNEVINVGRVTYGPDGDYIDEYDSTDASEASPTSEERFGRIVRDENLSDILVANDVNLGTARARLIYESNYLPKKRIRMTTKMIPHLDLSDKIKISLYDNPVQRQAIFGDPMTKWGSPYSGFDDPLNVLARNMECKVMGIVYDVDKFTCDLELKEI